MTWLQFHKDGWVLALKVTAGARLTALGPSYGPWLKMRVHAPPEKGQANEQIRRWFCEKLALRQEQVQILSGQLQSLKRLLIRGVSSQQLRALVPVESPAVRAKENNDEDD